MIASRTGSDGNRDPQWHDFLIVIIAVAVGLARVGGVKHGAYQALAHVFVGGLGGAGLAGRRRFYWFLFWALNVVEVLCFLRSRHVL